MSVQTGKYSVMRKANVHNIMLGILATWRLTALLVTEEGPFDLLGKFRDWIGVRYDESSHCYGTNVIADSLCCFWCASVWAGAIIALLQGGGIRRLILRALAYSAGAIWFKRLG